MKALLRAVLTLAGVALFAPTVLAAQAKPVIAVLYFDNNSIGKDRADYDGVGKGIADMLITDMASNPNVRIVERERIQALLVEQNLTKAGTIDPQTAIRIGKIIGAQYMITGGFMSDGRGTYVLTSRAINVESSAITNPIRITSKGDDVLGLINQLSTKLSSDMKLPALQVGQAGEARATPAVPAADAKVEAKAEAKAEKREEHAAHHEAKADAKDAKHEAKADAKHVAAKPDAKPARAAESKPAPKQKMDIRTAMLYAKAIEAEDAGNRSRAVELYRQVVDRFPLPSAQEKITKLSRG